MIEVRIQQAARRRGLNNSHQLSLSIGVSRMVGSRLWEGKQEPKLSTLDKICEAWGCELSELIVRVPDKKHRTSLVRQNGSKADKNGPRTSAGKPKRSRQSAR